MADKTVFFRYNPSKRSPGTPWQVKTGRFGRPFRTRKVEILSARQRRRFKASPGEWFPGT